MNEDTFEIILDGKLPISNDWPMDYYYEYELVFKNPYIFKVVREIDYNNEEEPYYLYKLDDDSLNISIWNSDDDFEDLSHEEIMERIRVDVIIELYFLWKEYVLDIEGNLSTGALGLRSNLKSVLKEL